MKVIVDKARLFRRAIIICWITLAVCFVVKVFGGNFFEIMCENENYKAICNYADTHFWCKYLICFLSSMLCEVLYILAITQKIKPSKIDWAMIVPSIIVSCFLQLLAGKWSIITDIWIFFLLPCVLLGKEYKKYLSVLIAWLLTFLFQVVSLAVKNLAIAPIDGSTFVSLIYSIDIYIMCGLYYLYRNFNKECKGMGAFWGMFMGKPEAKLIAMKKRYEAKIKKYQVKANAVDYELARKKGEK